MSVALGYMSGKPQAEDARGSPAHGGKGNKTVMKIRAQAIEEAELMEKVEAKVNYEARYKRYRENDLDVYIDPELVHK